ncbi:MAG: DUF559 domain-containing protein [Ruminococcaceae bacterium]|nr:DUF559 domain-containing protein [Oscillospiraceae bacterium]
MSLNYNKKIIPFAKELRKNMTPQEKKLWYKFLSKYPIRFQRQKVIDNYIADFYCHSAKLVIEIDGSQHRSHNGKILDNIRTSVLNGYGVKVLRFSNEAIEINFNRVCELIDEALKEVLA